MFQGLLKLKKNLLYLEEQINKQRFKITKNYFEIDFELNEDQFNRILQAMWSNTWNHALRA